MQEIIQKALNVKGKCMTMKTGSIFKKIDPVSIGSLFE